jgi:hypothetical protein
MRATRRRFVVMLTLMAPVAGCHIESRSRRAEQLLGELAPSLRLGESLADARRAMPALGVRHPGDSPNMYEANDAAPPRAVAVVVWPGPAVGEHASPDAIVEAVEFVMSPTVAGTLRQHVNQLFGTAVQSTCAGQSLEQTDAVAVWDLGRRGGVLLTFPEQRPDGVAPTSRLFIYTGGWEPARSLSGYGQRSCSVVP